MSSDSAEMVTNDKVEANSPITNNSVDDTSGSAKEVSANMTKMMQDNSNGVMWEMDSVRKLFKERRMWPTFVGPKFIQNGTTKITLPVLVWQEQQQYCQETAQRSTKDDNLLKRKRADSSSCTQANNSNSSQCSSASANDTHHITNTTATATTTTTVSTDRENPHPQQHADTLTPEQRTRCAVFRDLHDQGYFVGPADAYGGDYSLYKGGGDPTQTHSIATVRVISRGHKITARELLAFSRVQNQVAKSAVLAFSLPETSTPKGNNSNNTTSPTSASADCHAGVSNYSASNRDGTTQSEATNTTQDNINGHGSSEKREGGNNGVAYLVINFRNVSDRL